MVLPIMISPGMDWTRVGLSWAWVGLSWYGLVMCMVWDELGMCFGGYGLDVCRASNGLGREFVRLDTACAFLGISISWSGYGLSWAWHGLVMGWF
jgi:hypothetical protein